mgnify:CR=1 FL=1
MSVSKEDLQLLAEAYQQSPDRSASAKVRAMVRAEVDRVDRAFAALKRKIQVVFTPKDPYPSYEAMVQRVLSEKTMLVYTGFSETPLWTPEQNWKARAVHDWDHIRAGVDFSMRGEAAAFRKSAARMEQLAPLYLSEIALQAAQQNYTGNFDDVQKVVIPTAARVDRIARSLGSVPQPTKQQAAFVWRAAGVLRFAGPQGLMLHLRVLGLDEASAVQVGAAALLLHRFGQR